MSEAISHRRPTSFHMKLHVDPADDNEPDIPLTTRSWRVQLLRLLQRAPHPVPVLCEEPRVFPHFGDEQRISESSWTSASTHSTDVFTDSGSLTLASSSPYKGANENYQTEAVPACDSLFQPKKLSTTTTVVDTGTFTAAGQKGFEICVDGNCVNRKDEVEEKLSECPSHPPENSNGKAPNNGKHQPQNEERSESRSTLSLSIHGDPEYWEKFRYSKDYQSIEMIETICNEVFNLKPSLRYKSLMKLSATGRECISINKTKDNKQPGLGFPPQPRFVVVKCNDNDDEMGFKVEILETKKGTKRVKSISALKTRSKERQEKDRKRKAENAISFREEQHEQKQRIIIEKNTNSDDDDNGNEMEEVRQRREEKKSRNSITSSVFTATTASTSEDVEENYRKQKEMTLLLDGFGQAFHGFLTKRETEKLLRTEGQYLIRQMWNEDGFILSFLFDSQIRNYRLQCDLGPLEGKSADDALTDSGKGNTVLSCIYYLEDRRKCYHSVDELVREGLITLHLDENAGSYIDLLVELAQFQRNDNLLQTPPAVTPGSRKNSRSASFRVARLASSSSAAGSGGTSAIGVGGGNGVDGDKSPSITDGRISMDNIALLIHFFEEEMFDRPDKCQGCSKGIWGPSGKKGLRCRDCNIAVHECCMDSVKSECKPDLTKLSPFSTDLTSLVKGGRSSSPNESCSPPYILRICINEVEARGLTTEGIYRICGSVEEIEVLKNLFEKDKINTTLSDCPDIHSITSLIKFFLRQLPDSLITQDVFEEFTRENGSGEMKMDAVRTLVNCLPPAHKLTLKYLLEHLQRVAKEKGLNKMNAFNLSSILMPSLVGPTNMSFDTLESGTKLCYFLITQLEEIF